MIIIVIGIATISTKYMLEFGKIILVSGVNGLIITDVSRKYTNIYDDDAFAF